MANKRAGLDETDGLYTIQAAVMTGGVLTDLGSFGPGPACALIQWGYSVTVAMMCAATPGILTIDIADYNDVLNRTEVGTATMVDNRVAANTVFWFDFPLGITSGIALAEGRRIVVERQVGNLEGGAETGTVRVFVVYRMTGQ